MWTVSNAQNENWGLGHHNDLLERQKYHLKGLGGKSQLALEK